MGAEFHLLPPILQMAIMDNNHPNPLVDINPPSGNHHFGSRPFTLMESAHIGTERILKFCLELTEGDPVAVFYDDTTKDVATIFRETADRIGLKPIMQAVPRSRQFDFRHGEDLTQEEMEVLWKTKATISCLTDDPRGTSYRKRLVEDSLQEAESRVAHMPGATLDLLSMAAEIEYEEAAKMCDYLGATMALGRTATLQTFVLGADGLPLTGQPDYLLHMELGGPSRLPITSSGTIPPGTWGNVPGGETFIAPMEDTASGTFVLNGAFTDYVLRPPAHLVLHFERGQLVRTEGDAHAIASFEELFKQAIELGDPNCKHVAELGIGVNRGVRPLTGKSLFDEKIYGTAHIALGDSDRFGGRHASAIHEDLVTLRPSLWIDDSPVLTRGRLVFDNDYWQDRLDSGPGGAPPPILSAPVHSTLRRTAINTSEREGGLRVEHEVGANRNRRCSYAVGHPSASRVLAKLHRIIPQSPGTISISDLVSRAAAEGVSEMIVRRGLWALIRHHLIEVIEQSPQNTSRP